MKDLETKYKEAVARNLSRAQRLKAAGPAANKYRGWQLDRAKMALGVRKEDDQYDTDIKSLIKD